MQTFFWILGPQLQFSARDRDRLVLNAYVTVLVLSLNRSSRHLLSTQARLCSSIGHFPPPNFSDTPQQVDGSLARFLFLAAMRERGRDFHQFSNSN
jgi:hypothetical protein